MKIVTALNPPAHNSNFCYYDGKKLHYLHLERYLQIKHFLARKDFDLFPSISCIVQNQPQKRYSTTKLIIDKIFHHHINGLDKPSNYLQFDARNSHHEKHALSMELFSKQKYDLHVVIDGIGDFMIWSIIKNDQIIYSQNIFEAAGSIGGFMSVLGEEMDFKGYSLDFAGKIMGLQSYGKFDETYYKSLDSYNMNRLGDLSLLEYKETIMTMTIDQLRSNLLRLLNTKKTYAGYALSNLEENKKLNALHTIHKKLGEIVLSIFEKYIDPNDRVAYSGGVAQNVVWNTELKKRYPKLEILPHCGDEGISFGTMEFFRRKHDLTFDLSRYPFMQSDETPTDEPTIETIQKTARHLANGKIVAWYQGQGEVGPRALGHRSIFMDPRIKNGKDIINRVKNRESFRPFGASVLHEYAKEYFDLDFENPYMLYLGTTQKDNLDAITHVDGTCRAQTVNKDFDKNFRLLLEYFYDMTGCPVLLNTSLNEAGKPIAGWIRNAMNEFNTKAIDVLVVGNTIYEK